jgi:hypothetical protein
VRQILEWQRSAEMSGKAPLKSSCADAIVVVKAEMSDSAWALGGRGLGDGDRPLTAKTGVRGPLGSAMNFNDLSWVAKFPSANG